MYSIKKVKKIKKKKPATPLRITLRLALYLIGRSDAVGGRFTITPVIMSLSRSTASISDLTTAISFSSTEIFWFASNSISCI